MFSFTTHHLPRSVAARYREIAFFDGWTSAELSAFDRVADVVEYEPGDVVLLQGAAGHEFVLLTSGRALLSDITMGRRAGVLPTGSWMGDQAMRHNVPQPLTAIADGYVRVLRVGPREFHGLLATCPAFVGVLDGSPLPVRHVAVVQPLPRTA